MLCVGCRDHWFIKKLSKFTITYCNWSKKSKSFVYSSNIFVLRHFIIRQNSTFFLLFGDFEDGTEVIDSIFFYFRVETKGLSYGLFFTWPKNVRDMSRIPHKINDNWRRWPSLPSAAAATVVFRLHCCCFNFFCEEEPNAIFCNNTQPTHCFTLKTSYEFQFRPLLINRWH